MAKNRTEPDRGNTKDDAISGFFKLGHVAARGRGLASIPRFFVVLVMERMKFKLDFSKVFTTDLLRKFHGKRTQTW